MLSSAGSHVLGAMVSAALLVSANSMASATAELTCEAWAALKIEDRRIIIGSALEQRVGRPESSKLAACLWSIYDQIADHTTDICARDGGAYGPAAGLALESAIDFCESR